MKKTDDIKVFISSGASKCDECNKNLDLHAWITLKEDKGALCLECSDLDHLAFLPGGNAALTRRSRKYSTLSAIVLKWNKSRKRYERQGLLVEKQGIEKAEEECFADEEVRQIRNGRAAIKREEMDVKYVAEFGQRIREFFPYCPQGRENEIAEHACLKYSRRVGRSAAAKEMDEDAVRLAVIAHIRHTETEYDKLLASGCNRMRARHTIEAELGNVLEQWERGRKPL